MISRKIKFLILLIGIFLLVFSYKSHPKYYLSICAIFRNEARFLPEWIEYHRLCGVDHFYLLNNLSDDDYQTVLKPYLDKGIVELYEWPYHGSNQKQWNKIQCSAYSKILKEKKNETSWLAIIDTDEFLVSLKASDLKTLLKSYEPYGGLAINWQLFGTSNVEKIPENKSVIGTLLHRAPENHPTNHFFKSIVQPKKVKKITQPHYCLYRKPYFHVAENKKRIPSKSLSPTISIEKIKLYHYTYRDEQFFKNEKQKRYREWHPEMPLLQEHPSYNEVSDTTLVNVASEVEKVLRGKPQVIEREADPKEDPASFSPLEHPDHD